MTTATIFPCLCHQPYGDVKIDLQRSEENALSIKIETKRLIIESVNSTQYLSDLIELYGSKSVNALVGDGSTKDADSTAEKVERWIARWSNNSPFAGYIVREKDSGKFVGQIILKPVKATKKPVSFIPGATEIGFLSKEAFWKKGYGKEYTHAMVHHLIPELIRQGYQVKETPIQSIMATARVDNKGSNAVLSKFMTYTETKARYGGIRNWYQHNYKEHVIRIE